MPFRRRWGSSTRCVASMTRRWSRSGLPCSRSSARSLSWRCTSRPRFDVRRARTGRPCGTGPSVASASMVNTPHNLSRSRISISVWRMQWPSSTLPARLGSERRQRPSSCPPNLRSSRLSSVQPVVSPSTEFAREVGSLVIVLRAGRLNRQGALGEWALPEELRRRILIHLPVPGTPGEWPRPRLDQVGQDWVPWVL